MKFIKRALPCCMALLLCFLSLFSVSASAAEVIYNLNSFSGYYMQPATSVGGASSQIDFSVGSFPLSLETTCSLSSNGSGSMPTFSLDASSFLAGSFYQVEYYFPSVVSTAFSQLDFTLYFMFVPPSGSPVLTNYSDSFSFEDGELTHRGDRLGGLHIQYYSGMENLSYSLIYENSLPVGISLSFTALYDLDLVHFWFDPVYSVTGPAVYDVSVVFNSADSFTIASVVPPFEAFMSNLGNIFTSLLGVVPNLANMIITTPLLLVPIGLVVGGAAFGFLSRGSKRN